MAAQAPESVPLGLLRGRKLRKYDSAFEEVSSKAHEATTPLFIPVFTGLRRTVVEHLTESLQRVEREITLERSAEKISTAITLLRQMGKSRMAALSV